MAVPLQEPFSQKVRQGDLRRIEGPKFRRIINLPHISSMFDLKIIRKIENDKKYELGTKRVFVKYFPFRDGRRVFEIM